jgi:hypothetical protein
MDPIVVDGHRVVLLLVLLEEEGDLIGDNHAMRTGCVFLTTQWRETVSVSGRATLVCRVTQESEPTEPF